MGSRAENSSFICEVCGEEVLPLTNGSFRNHCPFCLSSKHLDIIPGDRLSECLGVMKAVDVIKTKKGFQLVHECRECGHRQNNKVAENTVQPDDYDLILEIMRNKAF